MKFSYRTLIWSIEISFIILFLYSCGKSLDDFGEETPAFEIGRARQAPIVMAGEDVTIYLPDSNVKLTGSYDLGGNTFVVASWRKIDGTDSYYFASDRNKIVTTVSGLKEGAYKFELTVTSYAIGFGNLEGRDTVSVFVRAIQPTDSTIGVVYGRNEVTFTNLRWVFPWYSSLAIGGIYKYIPRNKELSVFVIRSNSVEWIQVPPYPAPDNSRYDYFIMERPDHDFYSFETLYVSYYGMDTNDTPSLKVKY